MLYKLAFAASSFLPPHLLSVGQTVSQDLALLVQRGDEIVSNQSRHSIDTIEKKLVIEEVRSPDYVSS